MSNVISFRLNKENPREGKALQILQSRRAKGYSVRQIIIEALLAINEVETENLSKQIEEINVTLSQVSRLLKQTEHRYFCIQNTGNNQSNINLSNNFLTSVKKAIKPGMTTDKKI